MVQSDGALIRATGNCNPSRCTVTPFCYAIGASESPRTAELRAFIRNESWRTTCNATHSRIGVHHECSTGESAMRSCRALVFFVVVVSSACSGGGSTSGTSAGGDASGSGGSGAGADAQSSSASYGATSASTSSAGGGKSSGVTTGGGDESCTDNSACDSGQYCRLTIEACPEPAPPKIVVVTAGICRPLGGPCSKPADCSPMEICEGGTCESVPDLCTIAPPTCPAGCVWSTNPCACVCGACP